MTTSHFKVSRHKVVDVPNEYVDSEDGQLSSHFTKKEISILKYICSNPMFKNFEPLPSYEIHVPITLKHIRELIFFYYDIRADEFYNKRRDETLIKARRDFVHLARKNTDHSNFVIGRAMGKDNSTVCYYLKQETENLLEIYNAKTY